MLLLLNRYRCFSIIFFCMIGIFFIDAQGKYYSSEQREQCISWLQSEQEIDHQEFSQFLNTFFASIDRSTYQPGDQAHLFNAFHRMFADILEYSSCPSDTIVVFIETWIRYEENVTNFGIHLPYALCLGHALPPSYLYISYEGFRYIPSFLEQVMLCQDSKAKQVMLQLGYELITTRYTQRFISWIEALSNLLPYCDNEEDRALLRDYGAVASKANSNSTGHALIDKKPAVISPLSAQEQSQRWNMCAKNFTCEELVKMFGPYDLLQRSLAEKNWPIVRWCARQYRPIISCKEFSKFAEGFDILAEYDFIDFNGPLQENMLWILWSSAVYYQNSRVIELLKKREDTQWFISRYGAAFIVQAARKKDKKLIQELQQLGASITEALCIVTKQPHCMRRDASRIFHTVWANGWGSDELVYDPDQSSVRSMLSLLAECTSAEEFESVARVEDMKKWWPDYAWKTRGRVSVFLEGIFGNLSN